ncbi:MAG: sensor histidine kinase, partial [Nitrospira sp.]|nr:sensor histidine kinase [Nitrospira sp.]
MISQLVSQLGVDVNCVVQPNPEMLMAAEQKTYNVFHIPEAVGSPYIPGQEGFVIPFHVQSVLGFGGLLPSGELFAMVLFSRTRIPHDTAELFAPGALAVKSALLPFDRTGSIFVGTGRPATSVPSVEQLMSEALVH